MDKGLVQIYTGEGKGKTTAAFGQAMRAAGRGLSVEILQFLKGRDSGEVLFLREQSSRISVQRFNSLRKMPWKMNTYELAILGEETKKGMEQARQIATDGNCDLLILDEIIGACNKGIVTIDDIEDVITMAQGNMEIILTGRHADEKLVAIADLVTEMKKIKHPFDRGVQARTGIER